jgi:ribose transport system substrate-binding protein
VIEVVWGGLWSDIVRGVEGARGTGSFTVKNGKMGQHMFADKKPARSKTRRAVGFIAACALAVLTACGGGEEQQAASQEAPARGSGGPQVVSGPGYMPDCFVPWSADIKYYQWPARKGPFKIALVNGYVGNAWRIQMVKTAKTFAKDAAIAPLIKEFRIVSTGTDIAAQLGAIEDFINQDFDAIITLAVSPQGFDRVIRLANRKNVVIVPFDNVLDTDAVMQVNEDQLAMGRQWAEFIDEILGGKGKILEVRGLQGNSVDRDRHIGIREVMEAPGKDYQIIEVVGNWDDGQAQKAVANALATHGEFDALMTQGGSTGALRALLDAKHRPIPVTTEAENGARKLIAQYHEQGMKGLSLGQSPGLAAIAMKAALEALQGKVLPQLISVPIPAADHTTLKDGVNYFSELSDNFFTPNAFPPCGVNISGVDIMNEEIDAE